MTKERHTKTSLDTYICLPLARLSLSGSFLPTCFDFRNLGCFLAPSGQLHLFLEGFYTKLHSFYNEQSALLPFCSSLLMSLSFLTLSISCFSPSAFSMPCACATMVEIWRIANADSKGHQSKLAGTVKPKWSKNTSHVAAGLCCHFLL